MRLAGTCNSEAAARRCADYLLTLGIAGEVRAAGETAWGVWVYNEDEMGRATKEVAACVASPNDARYEQHSQAEAIRQKTAAIRSEAIPDRSVPPPVAVTLPGLGDTPVTIALMTISIIVAMLTHLASNNPVAFLLQCTPDGLERGEIWRVVSPIFLHFGFLHILFNMLWLFSLGRMIEAVKGRLFLAGLVLLTAILPNCLQMLMGGSDFGGMSGVVYGLFGYIWIKSRMAPEPGLSIDPVNTTLILLWFAMGVMNLLGPVANWAHGAGLAIGAAMGAAPIMFRRLRHR